MKFHLCFLVGFVLFQASPSHATVSDDDLRNYAVSALYPEGQQSIHKNYFEVWQDKLAAIRMHVTVGLKTGGGVKYMLSSKVQLGLEAGLRKLFTDYLDDLSSTYIDPSLFDKYLTPQQAINAKILNNRQLENHAGPGGKRGTRTNNDGYFTFCIKASVVIGRERMKK